MKLSEKPDDSIIAAITAALNEYSKDNGKILIVKSIVRMPQSSPLWNVVGRIERLGRKMNSI